MPYLKTKSADLYFETVGEGPKWVTLLNGFSRTMNDFRGMARDFNQRGLGVVLIDHRGAGKSQVRENFTLEHSAEDVVAVWDELGISRSALLGISFGGAVAMYVALNFPARVWGLVLASTAAADREVHSGTPPTDASPEAAEKFLSHYLSEPFVAGHKILVKSLAKEMAHAFLDEKLKQGARLQRSAMRNFDINHRVSEIRIPTLVIHGTADRVTKFSSGEYLKAQIRGAKIAPFEGSGHLLLAEAPKRLYETAGNFLASL